MRLRDWLEWIGSRPILGLGSYLACVIVLATVATWGFAHVMAEMIAVSDLAAPRAQPSAPSVAAVAAAPAELSRAHEEVQRAEQAARDAGGAGDASTLMRAVGLPARTVNNPADDPMAAYVADDGATYRTVCVRLCDGYFWPISAATHRGNLASDRDQCESSCGSPVRLYVHRVPGGSTDDMQDLAGHPYTRLKTAFMFRRKYDAACKCSAHPWEKEARDRHRVYALEQSIRKGDRQAYTELAELRVKVEADRRREVAQKQQEDAKLVASGSVTAASALITPSSSRRDKSRERLAAKQDLDESKAMRLGGPGQDAGRGGGRGYSYSGAIGGGGSEWRNRAFNGN